MQWWCDELQDWKIEQVRWALRKWNREQPRKRPTPGDIVGILKAERGRRYAEQVKANRQDEPQQVERVSAERASEILAQAGFRPKKMSDEI